MGSLKVRLTAKKITKLEKTLLQINREIKRIK